MHWARCLSRWTEKGRAYGIVTALSEALWWGLRNAKSGLCFPSYETKSASFLMTSFASNASGCGRAGNHRPGRPPGGMVRRRRGAALPTFCAK